MSPLTDRLRVAAPAAGQGVTILELFFDLVFVFTITQLTGLVRSPDGHGYLHAAAILAITWWMYDGYAWLTNNVGPQTLSTRLPLLLAMTGFLVMAIATPDAYGSARWPFAIAYLIVVIIHSVQFARSSLGGSARAIRQITPLNLTVALLLVAAAWVGHRWGWTLWCAAVVVLLVSVATRRESGFSLRPDHFAERHELVVIIALGETIVATGAGAAGRIDQWRILIAVIGSMGLVSSLWWVYFGSDSDRAAAALQAASASSRNRRAILGYAVGHLIHVVGLILFAAGLREVVAAPSSPVSLRIAMTLAAGCATFLLAQIVFLGQLGLAIGYELGVAAIACAAVGVIGHEVNRLAELGALVVILVCTVTVRGIRSASPSSTAGSPT